MEYRRHELPEDAPIFDVDDQDWRVVLNILTQVVAPGDWDGRDRLIGFERSLHVRTNPRNHEAIEGLLLELWKEEDEPTDGPVEP